MVDPDRITFDVFNVEQLFRDIWTHYLADASVEEIVAERVERAVALAQSKRPRSPAELVHFRSYMRNHILDHPARFEESRRHFFMVDLFPENDARFNLEVTPSSQSR